MRKVVTQVAIVLEEIARRDSCEGRCLGVLLYSSLSDVVLARHRVLRVLVFSPALVFAALIVLYTLFCLVWLPLYVLSLAITWWGSAFLLLGCLVLAIRSFARTLIFPGSTLALQRQVSADYLRRLATQLEAVSTTATNFTATLMLVSSGRLGNTAEAGGGAWAPLKDTFAELCRQADGQLEQTQHWIAEAAQETLARRAISEMEAAPALALRRALAALCAAIRDLRAAATDVLSRGPASVYSHGNAQNNALLVLCKRLVQSSEALKDACESIRPGGVGVACARCVPGGGRCCMV